MKKIVFILFVITLIFSCNKEDELNSIPTAPILIYPSKNLFCVELNQNLQWSTVASEEGRELNYNLQVALDPYFENILFNITNNQTSKRLTFNEETTYYWRVRALDLDVKSSYSETYIFYTEGKGILNHLPFTPKVTQPMNGSQENNGTITLKWSVSDLDTEDILSYEVFFGNSENSLSKVGSKLSNTQLQVNATYSDQYYWKVIVKDNKGGETIGQIWSFYTE